MVSSPRQVPKSKNNQSQSNRCQLGKVVKSNSHCDYIVQVDTPHDVQQPPVAEDYGFGQFVKFGSDRHWAVGIIYDSQLFNSSFLNSGPRLTSAPDPIFTPDLIQDTCILLSVALIGSLQAKSSLSKNQSKSSIYGLHGIPRVVIPANTAVYQMDSDEVHSFHRTAEGKPQFAYYSHLLSCGGTFSSQLTEQVLSELIATELFAGAEQRALQILRKELSWKSTMSVMR